MFRCFRALLALVIFLTQSVLSHALETNVWAERQRALIPAAAAPKNLLKPLIPPMSDQNGTLSSALLKIPASVANVEKKQGSRIGNSRVVVHIRDVHQNLLAQKNIRSVIDALVQNGGIRLVGLEGAEGKLDFSPFNQLEASGRLQVADNMLARSEIGGPVHYALSKPEQDVDFVGVDDQKLFVTHWAAVRRVVSTAHALREALRRRSAALDQQKGVVFSAQLNAFDRSVSAYRQDQLSLGEYADVLANQGVSGPNLSLFRRARGLEAQFSMERIQRNRAAFLQRLLPVLSEADQSTLIALASASKSGAASTQAFYGQLETLSTKTGINIPSSVRDYLSYMHLSEQINADRLLLEVSNAEKQIYARLIRNPGEQKLINESEQLFLAQKLVNFSLTPEEWNAYRETEKHGDVLARFKPLFESFYELARRRDHAIAENLVAALDHSGNEQAILVTGGFHAPGIRAALEAKNIQVVSITPAIDVMETVSGADSLLVAANKKAVVADLFSSGNIFLSQPAWTSYLHQQFVLLWLTVVGSGVAGAAAVANSVLIPVRKKVVLLGTWFQNSFFILTGKSDLSWARARKGEEGRLETTVTPLFKESRSTGKSISGFRRAARMAGMAAVVMLAMAPAMVLAQSSGDMAVDSVMSALPGILTAGIRSFTLTDYFVNMLGAFIATRIYAHTYDKTHIRTDYDEDYTAAFVELAPLITFMSMFLQQNVLLGLALAYPGNNFRNRIVDKSQVDHTSLKHVQMIGFVASITNGLASWLLMGILLGFLIYVKYDTWIRFTYGRKFGWDGNIRISYVGSDPANDWAELNTFLAAFIKRRSDYTDASNGSVSFSFLLRDDTGKDSVLGTVAGLRMALKAQFKPDMFDFHVTKPSGVTFGSRSFLPPLFALGALGYANTASAADAVSATSWIPSEFSMLEKALMIATVFLIAVPVILMILSKMRSRTAAQNQELKLQLMELANDPKKRPDADLLKILLAGPRSDSLFRSLKHNFYKTFGVISLTAAIVIFFGVQIFSDGTSRSGRIPGEALVVERISVSAETDGWLKMNVKQYSSKIKKGDVLGTIYPTLSEQEEKTAKLEIDRVKARFEKEKKEAATKKEEARLNINQYKSQLGAMKLTESARTAELNDIAATIGMAEVELQLQENNLKRGKALLSPDHPDVPSSLKKMFRAISPQEVQTIEAARDTAKVNIAKLKIKETKLKADLEMVQAEQKELKGHVVPTAVDEILKTYQDHIATIDNEMKTEVASLEHRYAARPIIAEMDGEIADTVLLSNTYVTKGLEITRIRSAELPNEVLAFAPSIVNVPEEDDLVTVTNEKGQTADGIVSEVLEGNTAMPNDIEQAALNNLVNAVRRGRRTGLIPDGQPFKVRILPNSKFKPGARVSVVAKSKKKTITWGTATQVVGSFFAGADRLAGEWNGQQAQWNQEGGMRLAPFGFTEASGAATDGKIIAVVDDGKSFMLLYDAETGKLKHTVKLKQLAADHPEWKGELDLEAVDFGDDGSILLLSEDWQVVHRIKLTEDGDAVASFMQIQLPKEVGGNVLNDGEGLAYRKRDGHLFLVNNAEGKHPWVYEFSIVKGELELVDSFDLSETDLKPVREIHFENWVVDGNATEVLILLESQQAKKSEADVQALHALAVDGPSKGKLVGETLIPSALNLKQPEAMVIFPPNHTHSNTKLILSETKNHGASSESQADLTIGSEAEPAAANPGLYLVWLPLVRIAPVLGSVIGGAVEGYPSVLRYLIANDIRIALLWILFNAVVKAFGFVSFRNGQPVKSSPIQDPLGYLKSNIVSWTGLAGFFLPDGSPVWAIVLAGVLAHGLVNFIIAFRTTSFERKVSSVLRSEKLLLITVHDHTDLTGFSEDLAVVERVRRTIAADSRLAPFIGNVLVAYLGMDKALPLELATASNGFMAVSGPDFENDQIQGEIIFNLARVNYPSNRLVVELTKPQSDDEFAVISSQSQQLIFPRWLLRRMWSLWQALGFWTMSRPSGIEERIVAGGLSSLSV